MAGLVEMATPNGWLSTSEEQEQSGFKFVKNHQVLASDVRKTKKKKKKRRKIVARSRARNRK